MGTGPRGDESVRERPGRYRVQANEDASPWPHARVMPLCWLSTMIAGAMATSTSARQVPCHPRWWSKHDHRTTLPEPDPATAPPVPSACWIADREARSLWDRSKERSIVWNICSFYATITGTTGVFYEERDPLPSDSVASYPPLNQAGQPSRGQPGRPGQCGPLRSRTGPHGTTPCAVLRESVVDPNVNPVHGRLLPSRTRRCATSGDPRNGSVLER